VAFGFSLLAKEETIALPAFLLIFDLVRRERPVPWKYYAAMLGLAALAGARLFYVLHNIADARMGFGLSGISIISYALTQSRVIWTYLRLFIFPLGLNLDHDVLLSQGLLSPPTTLPALVGLALLIGMLAWWVRKGNSPALWGLGFFVLLAPSSSIVPTADVLFEHHTYFPLTCLTMAAACLLSRLPRRMLVPALVVLLPAFLMGTIARNRVWHDEESLWMDVIAKSPQKARGYFNLALPSLYQNPVRARGLIEHGLRLDPNDAEGHTNLGNVLLIQGEPQAALEHFRRALELGGEKVGGWNNMGAAYLHLGQQEDAVRGFRTALGLNPCTFAARQNLMRVLHEMERKDEALRIGQVPANCRLLPEQAQKLADYRRSLR